MVSLVREVALPPVSGPLRLKLAVEGLDERIVGRAAGTAEIECLAIDLCLKCLLAGGELVTL